MKKLFKGIIMFLGMVIVLGLIMTGEVNANSVNTLYPTSIENSSHGEINMGTSSSSWNYLNYGLNFITLTSNGRLQMDAQTAARHTVNTLGVQMYLQRWDATNNRWTNQAYLGISTQNNSTSVSRYATVTVPTGQSNYYRVSSFHYVSHNNIVESVTVNSGSIFVP